MSEQETPVWDPNMFYNQTEPEPTVEPTEEVEPKEPENVQPEPTEPEVIEEVEEEEQGSEESEPELSPAEQFVDIPSKNGDFREVSLEQILIWEKDGLRQSDYTKKTQKLADERRAFEADREGEVQKIVSQRLESVDGLITELETLIQQQDDAIDWDDLRQYDVGEYTKQKELKEARVKAVEEAKLKRNAKVEMTPEDIQREQQVLLKNNPDWLDKDGKTTEAHTKDMKLMSEYLVKQGYTAQEQENIVSAKHWQTLLDAARYRASLEKVVEVKKKVKKIPLTPKPKKTTVQKSNVSFADRFYSN